MKTMDIHIPPVLKGSLQIQVGDFDLEVKPHGEEAQLWLGSHLIAAWYAYDGRTDWLPVTDL